MIIKIITIFILQSYIIVIFNTKYLNAFIYINKFIIWILFIHKLVHVTYLKIEIHYFFKSSDLFNTNEVTINLTRQYVFNYS